MNKTELQELIQVQEDTEFLKKSYDSLKKKFTNQFVAIKNGDIIAHDKDLDVVFKKIKAQKLNPANVLIEYLHPNDMLLIL